MKYKLILALLTASALCQAFASGRATPPSANPTAVVEATAITGEETIRLDGNLTEEVWQRAAIIRDFRQREPKDGAPATFKTEARIIYDAKAIYVAVEAFDPEPAKIVGLLTRRDSSSPSDWISIAMDSYHDRRTAYEFAVNPAGVKRDKYIFNDGNGEDAGWDAVWDVAVQKDNRGWRAEFRIPFSQLRFKAIGKPVFAVAVVRIIGRLNETATWPLLSKSATGYVSSFAEIRGVELSRPPKRLEAAPYTVSKLVTEPRDPGNPLIKTASANASVGLDMKYAITPGLTLTATANPDFGQVEADPAVLNLSAFETFFSERRPFFVEGSEIFRFDIDCNDGQCSGLFYSRRIGRPPQVQPDVPDGGYSSELSQTTILGAAKLTGRVGGFSIGALNAVTAPEYATIANGPSRDRIMEEPATSYSVFRARRDFANQSSLGFMTTATNRSLTDPVRVLPGQAYTGGVDWDWRLKKRYSLSGYWAGSMILGDAAAIDRLQQSNVHSFQRPDATDVSYDPNRTALDGHSLSVSFSKIGGEKVRFTSNFGFKSPGFDINDLGYMQRADQKTVSNWLQLRHDKPSKHVRSFRINFNQWAGWNFDGDCLFNGANINAHAVFTNNWSTGAGINLNGAAFDDRLTRGGPGSRVTGNINFWHYLNSDDRKSLYGGTFLMYLNDRHGSRIFEFDPSLSFRPTSALLLSTGIRFTRNLNDSQWLKNIEDVRNRYIFSRLDQTTVALTARVNFTITPRLSIQLYAEPFVSAGAYTHFKELVNGRAERYEDRFAPFASTDNPDFHFTSFRTTNVLRWEYRPGSALFVVWQQARQDYIEGAGDFRFGRDFRSIFAAPAGNVLLVKLAHWFNF